MSEAKITVYRRQMRAPDDEDVKRYPYQADIYPASGISHHHGVGGTAGEALVRAAMHWRGYEQKKRPDKK